MQIIKKLIPVFVICSFSLFANDKPWSDDYQALLIKKVSERVPKLSTCPTLKYPNCSHKQIADFEKCGEGKILLFGYGSLMNTTSASRSVGNEAVESMKPAIAFGLKRLFNYKAANVTRWGFDLPSKEKAMLNVTPTTTYNEVINGVVMKISPEDLASLVQREEGYDLAPVLVTDWENISNKNPEPVIQIAYTFLVPNELRRGIAYAQTNYYPVRGYLHAVEDGASAFGQDFLNFWKNTTYLADGTTKVHEWDGESFCGLNGREP